MKIRVHMFFYTLKSMNDGIEIILVWCHLVVKMSEALFQTDTPSKKSVEPDQSDSKYARDYKLVGT